MALQLPDPMTLEQTIKLLKSDPSGETFVRIKQAITGENFDRAKLWANTALEWDDAQQGKVKQFSEVSEADIQATETRLVLLECNILGQDGKLLFPAIDPQARRDEDKFLRAWKSLLAEWSDEIYEAVLQVNPGWDRRRTPSLGEASGPSEKKSSTTS